MSTKTELTVKEAFEVHYPKDDLRDSTIKAMKHAVNKWEQLSENLPVSEVTNATLMEFRDACRAEGLANRTINGYWRSLRSIFRCVGPQTDGNPYGLGLIERVPAMRPLQEKFKRPKRIELETLSRCYIAARNMKHPKRGVAQPSLWWQTILIFVYFTGLRVADIFKARWDDIDWDDGTIYVCIEKTGVEADIPLHPVLMDHLKRMPQTDEVIFNSSKNCRYEFFTMLRRMAGVGQFGFHDIRRTAASEIEKHSPGMGKVLLLHAPTNVTERSYLNSLPELREAIEKMDIPIAFKHGIKATERSVEKIQKQIKVNPYDYAVPLHPPKEAFFFMTIGFSFAGRFIPAKEKKIKILKHIVENNCVGKAAELCKLVYGESCSEVPSVRKKILKQVSELRSLLREYLGIPDEFDPLPVLTAGGGSQQVDRFELFVLPEVMQHIEEKNT